MRLEKNSVAGWTSPLVVFPDTLALSRYPSTLTRKPLLTSPIKLVPPLGCDTPGKHSEIILFAVRATSKSVSNCEAPLLACTKIWH